MTVDGYDHDGSDSDLFLHCLVVVVRNAIEGLRLLYRIAAGFTTLGALLSKHKNI